MIAPRSRVSFTILASGGCILYNTLVNSYAERDIVPRLQRALLEISLGKAYEQIFNSVQPTVGSSLERLRQSGRKLPPAVRGMRAR